jgi:hypothetical protein
MTTPTGLNFGRDLHSYNAFAPVPSNTIFNATITDGTATHCTVPSTAPLWVVSYRYQPGSSVFVDVTGATAAVPAGATLASATAEGNPASHTLVAGTVISIITADSTADVSVVMWPCPNS